MRLLTLIFMLLSLSSYGQMTLEGKVADAQNGVLTGATIVLLSPQDSSMIAYGISDNDGIFYLEEVDSGDYILQVTYVSYAALFQDINVSKGKGEMDIGTLHLDASNEILQEVMVTAEHIPMGIKGDTISYNASAFKTRPGATVEDLLKKLPGIDVQRDGTIKAMGEDVKNVLVDGKEFFGDDPTIATKNLEAESVDKVELFDKKSEIAEFTGIDDGKEEKTLNLKLKEEYKNGGFGNVELAGGTASRYNGKLNYNRFSPKMQAAAIISSNNINQQAFSFNEYIQFMGGLGNAISSNNGMFNFGEYGQVSRSKGLSDNSSSGLNFNYDFSKKLELTSHYFFLNADQFLNTNTRSDEFTDQLSFNSLNNRSSNKDNQNHRLTARIKYKANPFLQVILKNSFYGIFNQLTNEGQTRFSQNGILTNTTSLHYLNQTDQLGYEGHFQVRGKFKKKGRNWINTAKYQHGILSEESDLLNEYFFQTADNTRIDQAQFYDYRKDNLTMESAYTEPLGRKFYLGLRYAFNLDEESPSKQFYDKINGEQLLNQSLSTEYKKTNTIHRGTLSLKKNAKRLKLNAGIGLQKSEIIGQLEGENDQLNNNFQHILPSASLEWDISSEKSMNFDYLTYVSLPTLNQLAPLPDNSNPNFLVIGNPALAPEYAHNIRWRFSSFDQFYHKNFYIHLNASIIEDRVINEVAIDENFLKTLSPINTDIYKRLSASTSYSALFKPLKLKYRIKGRLTYADYESNLNGLESGVKENNIVFDFSLENRQKDHVDIATGIRLDYNIRKYDINPDFDQTFFNRSLYMDGIFYIGEDWTISSTFDFVSYSGEVFSEKERYNLWNASVQKSFMDNKFSLTLTAYDLLRQNIGLDRYGSINSLREERYNTLTQYFLLGLKYKIGKKKKSGGIEFG